MLIKMQTYFGWLPIAAIIIIDFQLSLCGPLPYELRSLSEEARRVNNMYVPSVEDCIHRGQMEQHSSESASSRSDPMKLGRFRLFHKVEIPIGNQRKFALVPTHNEPISLPFQRHPLSPIQLFGPNDIYYCTEDEYGKVVIRKMSKENIQKLIATGSGSLPIPSGESTSVNGYQPEMIDVVKNVKNVVGSELSKPTPTIIAMPTIPGHANSDWSNILPSILSPESDVGIPYQPTLQEPENPPSLPHSQTLPTLEEPDEKTMIPVKLVTKDPINNHEKETQTSKPVYEILNTISPNKVTVNHYTGDQDQVAGASEAIRPILITSTGKPELSSGDDNKNSYDVHKPDNLAGTSTNENKKVTVSVIAESSSTSVKVSGQDEVKTHQGDPLKVDSASRNPEKPNDSSPLQNIHKDGSESKIKLHTTPVTENSNKIPTTLSNNPELSETFTENPEIKDGFSTFTIVSSSETKGTDNKDVEFSGAEIGATKKPDEELNSFERSTSKPEDVTSSSGSKSSDSVPTNNLTDVSVSNDIKISIGSVISQVSDSTHTVISALEDQKSKGTLDKEPIPAVVESKDADESNEFAIEGSTRNTILEDIGVSETTTNLSAESLPDSLVDETEGSGTEDTSTEAHTSEEVTIEFNTVTMDPPVSTINSDETISGGSGSESSDGNPGILSTDITGANSDASTQTIPPDHTKVSSEIDDSSTSQTDLSWLEGKTDEDTSTAAPEKSIVATDSTESPILRISVTPKEDVTGNGLPGIQEDGKNVSQSNIVRIQPTHPMSAVHDILQTALPNSTPDYEPITLPTEGATAANGIASGLIAGFSTPADASEKLDVPTMITLPSIMFNELPKVSSIGGSKISTTSSESSPSSITYSKNNSSEVLKVTEKSETQDSSSDAGILVISAEESSDPLSNPSSGSISTSSVPSEIDVTASPTTGSVSITENSGLSSSEAQTRPKIEKKETGMEGFEKVSTIAPPDSKVSSTSEQTKITQTVSVAPSTEPTKWVPVSQPDDPASKTDSVSPDKKPDERVSPSPPLMNDLKPSPGLDASTQELDPHNAYFYNLSNELAMKMWTAINSYLKPSRTIAVSPFGLSGMLAMIYFGARGPTSDEMNEILKLDDDGRPFNPHLVFQDVSDSIGLARNQGITNAVFVEELFADKGKVSKLKGHYKDKARRFYKGIVTEVNFSYVSDAIRRRTNLMVRKDTGGKIRDFIRGNQLPLRTPMSALSANVFQTDCSSANISSEGRDGELYFTVSPKKQRKLINLPAVLWKSGVHAGYESSLDASAFALGGPENIVSTIFVIPGDVVAGSVHPDDNLEKLERRLIDLSLHDGAWNKLLKRITPRPSFELHIPKFSHTSIINATAALKSMGFRKLFTREAGLIDTAGLHLSDVFQMNLFTMCGDQNIHMGKHLEEVYPTGPLRSSRTYEEPEDYEDSTEEKKTTPESERSPKYSRQDDNTKRFSLNNPFLYFVRHNPTGLILHMGRFNPRSQQ